MLKSLFLVLSAQVQVLGWRVKTPLLHLPSSTGHKRDFLDSVDGDIMRPILGSLLFYSENVCSFFNQSTRPVAVLPISINVKQRLNLTDAMVATTNATTNQISSAQSYSSILHSIESFSWIYPSALKISFFSSNSSQRPYATVKGPKFATYLCHVCPGFSPSPSCASFLSFNNDLKSMAIFTGKDPYIQIELL